MKPWSTDDTAAALFLPVAMRTTPSMATSTIGTNFGVAGVGSGISAITLAERDVNNQLFTLMSHMVLPLLLLTIFIK